MDIFYCSLSTIHMFCQRCWKNMINYCGYICHRIYATQLQMLQCANVLTTWLNIKKTNFLNIFLVNFTILLRKQGTVDGCPIVQPKKIVEWVSSHWNRSHCRVQPWIIASVRALLYIPLSLSVLYCLWKCKILLLNVSNFCRC